MGTACRWRRPLACGGVGVEVELPVSVPYGLYGILVIVISHFACAGVCAFFLKKRKFFSFCLNFVWVGNSEIYVLGDYFYFFNSFFVCIHTIYSTVTLLSNTLDSPSTYLLPIVSHCTGILLILVIFFVPGSFSLSFLFLFLL